MIDLKFNKVSKRYRVRQELPREAARNAVLRKIQSLRPRAQDFWAVRDVSFEVERGQTLGIIGHNGAGKSTILKLLANITAPTNGEITINGRLSALIEVGSGFHPELTGRENIYLNGSILGMRRREISEKLDSIVDFAGIRQFIDTPVKRFSSGMYVRLGFSIAAHLDPDILLLDEVLAVGDAAFQAKCLQRIDELKRSGTTIIFISHDLGAIERVCDRVLLMHRGEIVTDGTSSQAIAEYQRQSSTLLNTMQDNRLSKEVEITSVSLYRSKVEDFSTFYTGEPLKICVNFIAHERVMDTTFEIFINSLDGEMQCHLTTELSNKRIDLESGTGNIVFSCGELGLSPGLYNIDATIIHRGQALGAGIDWRQRCATLRVDSGKITRGKFYMPHQWKFTSVNNLNNHELGEKLPEEVNLLT